MYVYVRAIKRCEKSKKHQLTFINTQYLEFSFGSAIFVHVETNKQIKQKMNKKRFIANDEVFGYSIWNKRPKFKELGFPKKTFAIDDFPYEQDNSCYVSEDLVKILMGADFSLKIGECMEITIN